MIALVTILIILACVVLAFFVLIQNPKGGGLAGAFGSVGTQVMGVKQTTDVMEKGTWSAMGIIAGLCIISVMFFETPKAVKETKQPASSGAPASNGGQQQQAPAGK
jgi:preprotein translocase subunit SecG